MPVRVEVFRVLQSYFGDSYTNRTTDERHRRRPSFRAVRGFASVQHAMLELGTPRARRPSQLGCRCGWADEYDSQAGEGATLVQEEAVQDELVREFGEGPADNVVDLPQLPDSEAVRELEGEQRGLGLGLRLRPEDPHLHLRLRVDRKDSPNRLPRGDGLALAIQTRIELSRCHLRRAAREQAAGEQGHDGGLIPMVNPHGGDIDTQGLRLDPSRSRSPRSEPVRPLYSSRRTRARFAR
jgi:hypothetical protein